VITFEQFQAIDLRVVTILEATPHPKADKLVLLKVLLGPDNERQIVAGIRDYYNAEDLAAMIGKQIVIVANLEPRVLRGEQSHGMVLAAKDDQGRFALCSPTVEVASGSRLS
jgi:methionyl-tRNA synthetase